MLQKMKFSFVVFALFAMLATYFGPLVYTAFAQDDVQARCLSDLLRADEKISACTQAIKKYPKNSSLWAFRGMAWKGKQEPERAIADLTKAIELSPTNAQAYFNRSELLWERFKRTGSHDDLVMSEEDENQYNHLRYGNTAAKVQEKPRVDEQMSNPLASGTGTTPNSSFPSISDLPQSFAELQSKATGYLGDSKFQIFVGLLFVVAFAAGALHIFRNAQPVTSSGTSAAPITIEVVGTIDESQAETLTPVEMNATLRIDQSNNLTQALERLEKLHEKGILTEAEFEQEKRRLPMG